MPIRNESRYIQRSLSAVMAQDYPPDRIEILVVDGMSEDGTRDIVRSMVEGLRVGKNGVFDPGTLKARDVRIIDNPQRIVSTGFNIALRQARGDVVIIVGGHCELEPDYVRRCVGVLRDTSAHCVGGPMATVGETWVARGIAMALSSFFGVGGAAFRQSGKRRGYVDTVAFGAYRREVFDTIGVFDEELVRNQDDEFNFRLIQAGGRIWLDPAIRSVYLSRNNLLSLWHQYFQYGFYKVLVICKRRALPSWRHPVAGAFVLGLVGSLFVALLTGQPLWALSVAGPYAFANTLASVWTARKDIRTLPILPLANATIHLAYGLGSLLGLWRWRKRLIGLIARTGTESTQATMELHRTKRSDDGSLPRSRTVS